MVELEDLEGVMIANDYGHIVQKKNLVDQKLQAALDLYSDKYGGMQSETEVQQLS